MIKINILTFLLFAMLLTAGTNLLIARYPTTDNEYK